MFVLQDTVKSLTSELAREKQKRSDSEAKLQESIKQKETTIANITREKEDIEKELKELKVRKSGRAYSVSSLHISYSLSLSLSLFPPATFCCDVFVYTEHPEL